MLSILSSVFPVESSPLWDVLRSMLFIGALSMALAVGIRAWHTRSVARWAVCSLLVAVAADTARRLNTGEEVVLYLYALRFLGVAGLTYAVWKDPKGKRFA